MNSIDLNGRRAVVTGGAQGIGLAIVRRLLASGARVAIWDLDLVFGAVVLSKIEGAEGSYSIACDVSDYDSVVEALRYTMEGLGGVDILVNNAGIAGANAPLADYAVEEWRRVVATDLDGVFHCCKAVVPGMVAQGYGRIVNVASIAGKEGNPNAAAYSAAKAGVIALTKSLGKELAGHDIAVNCITPAAAKTAIFAQMTESHIAYMLSKIPRGRFVEVDEIAALVAWLVSAENSFTTGAVFDLSGGRATY
ncbi:MAG TPA: SDR family NAD(P)-dependent oxidoreductase [Kiloniellales bacterium]|nr:SDR family NAD(P)-dependent oxidoreductase [Kiloniellales bacterium]